jgi:hypothetical protein
MNKLRSAAKAKALELVITKEEHYKNVHNYLSMLSTKNNQTQVHLETGVNVL